MADQHTDIPQVSIVNPSNHQPNYNDVIDGSSQNSVMETPTPNGVTDTGIPDIPVRPNRKKNRNEAGATNGTTVEKEDGANANDANNAADEPGVGAKIGINRTNVDGSKDDDRARNEDDTRSDDVLDNGDDGKNESNAKHSNSAESENCEGGKFESDCRPNTLADDPAQAPMPVQPQQHHSSSVNDTAPKMDKVELDSNILDDIPIIAQPQQSSTMNDTVSDMDKLELDSNRLDDNINGSNVAINSFQGEDMAVTDTSDHETTGKGSIQIEGDLLLGNEIMPNSEQDAIKCDIDVDDIVPNVPGHEDIGPDQVAPDIARTDANGHTAVSHDEVEDGEDDSMPAQFTTLNMAVKNDSPHSVEKLLEQCTSIQMFSALLFSINLGRHQITKIFLDHPKYTEISYVTDLMKKGALQQAIADAQKEADEDEDDDSIMDADVTPLMLAAQRNQFEVVESLLAMGDTINQPHPTGCRCDDCRKHGVDELRQAKTQLTTYRALASNSYIILANEDPIYAAFTMGQTMQSLAMKEKHYKAEYLNLSNQCIELSGQILSRVRDGRELDIILNEKYGSSSSYGHMARLNFAIQNGEKKFVAHSTCQKKLASLWMGHLNPQWVASPIRAIWFFIIFTLLYPVCVLIYWIYPYGKMARFLQIPFVKFMANTASYIVFVVLMVGFGTEQPPQPGATLCKYSDPIGANCRSYMDTLYVDSSGSNHTSINGTAMHVRYHRIPAGTYVFVIWLFGLAWENIKKIASEKRMYFSKLFNILDFIQIMLFMVAFFFSFSAVGYTNHALSYYRRWDSWTALVKNDNSAVEKAYWLNADRTTWAVYDPTIIAEAVMAVASLLTVAKITNVFTISEKIGPLLLSLAKMIEDMTAFSVVFLFIVGSFVVGFHNLFFFWYTSVQLAIGKLQEGDDPVNDLQSITAIVKTCFWSIFGMTDLGDETFKTYEHGQVTTITGHVMFAFYNWMMVIILINMLIAMMSRSYEIISETEDTEWKFARTKLFMEYIREGSTLATPFNLVPTWKGVYTLHKNFADNWCYRMAGRKAPDKSEVKAKLEKKNKKVGKNGSKSFLNMGDIAGKLNETKSKSDGKQPSEEYLKVIGVVKKRFVLNYGKGDDDEQDDVGEDLGQLKVDMSTLRQELMSNLYRQDEERAKMAKRISGIEKLLVASNHLYSQQHVELRDDNTQKVASLKDDSHHVDDKMKVFQEDVRSTMNGLRGEVTAQVNDTNRGINRLKDLLTQLSSDVSVLSERRYAAWQSITRARTTPQKEPPEESQPAASDIVRSSTPEPIKSSPTDVIAAPDPSRSSPTDDFVDIEVPDDASTPEHPTEVVAEPKSPRYSGPFAEVINKILTK